MKDNCKECKYSYGFKVNDGKIVNVGCQYILITGKRRGCDPENCTKFEKGKRIKAKY